MYFISLLFIDLDMGRFFFLTKNLKTASPNDFCLESSDKIVLNSFLQISLRQMRGTETLCAVGFMRYGHDPA